MHLGGEQYEQDTRHFVSLLPKARMSACKGGLVDGQIDQAAYCISKAEMSQQWIAIGSECFLKALVMRGYLFIGTFLAQRVVDIAAKAHQGAHWCCQDETSARWVILYSRFVASLQGVLVDQ